MTKARRRRPREAVTGAVYPDFVLTDEQWNEILRLSGIPSSAVGIDNARLELQEVLGLYRLRTQLRLLPDDARNELAGIRRDLRNLKARFARLARFLPASWSISFSEELRICRLLEDRYFVSEAGLIGSGCGKMGPKTGADYILVAYLVGFAERFGGERIRRPKGTRFVEYICKIADPGIGSGTIDNAMEDCINHRNKRSRKRW